jgi:serine/threonine protein phosphatase PrpC
MNISYGVETAALTDVGMEREADEDTYYYDDELGIYVVCDGMGGHASGEVASQMAVEVIARFYNEFGEKQISDWPFPVADAPDYYSAELVNSIKIANERVFIQSCKDRRHDGMGTTIVALSTRGPGVSFAHVGDSRIYRMRDGELTQITQDHSLFNLYQQSNVLTEEQLAKFQNKNIILRAMGLKDSVEVDFQTCEKVPGDVYLMCSDGLTDLVEDWIIAEMLGNASESLDEIAASLVRLANGNGGKDNITVMLMRIQAIID